MFFSFAEKNKDQDTDPKLIFGKTQFDGLFFD